ITVTHAQSLGAVRSKFEGLGLPPHIVLDLMDSVSAIELGYYNGQELSDVQQNVRANLPRKLKTFEEFLHENPDFLKE
ncbi:hypothetical protein EXIGLDRAFT_784145, partial [Exidia glandulosa HHB12029]